MDQAAAIVKQIADAIALYAEVWILIGLGIFYTVITRGVQFRLFRHMWHVVLSSRKDSRGGISSFQAFTISLAARVGVGNVFGVAAALIIGGPGAIFWMWIVALVGMATSFMESTLAQIFKVKNEDGTFRGGPAYYMWLGLHKRWFGSIFAVIAIITCGFVITSVQSNAIAGSIMATLGTTAAQQGTHSAIIAVILFVFAAPIILGGIRSVARVTEWMAPIMAVVYVIIAAIILVMNIGQIPAILALIVKSAFTGGALGGGIGGGIFAALINGVQRGLFSNEAGQGTAPNAAATATVSHPVRQGLIQSLGVFVDTIIVCSATAIIILSAPKAVLTGADPSQAASLTTVAVASQLGDWSTYLMLLIISVLAFSSIIAAYVYSDVNMSFVTSKTWASWLVRIVSVASVV
ncbi:MAG: alanine/glycine:cation symporter family protein, partial [Varibaculum cambriense]|nr:alanine/glycine:cation symporter family protein [Varibaculum cambriense]